MYEPITCPPEWENRDMPTSGDLAMLLGGSEDSFTGHLLNLMQKADPGRRRALANAFPREHRALALWENLDPAPKMGEVTALFNAMQNTAAAMADAERMLDSRGVAIRLPQLDLTEDMVARLCMLAAPDFVGPMALHHVFKELLTHAQHGVLDPGSWQRAWIMQLFGDKWVDWLEPAGSCGHHHRPGEQPPAAPPGEDRDLKAAGATEAGQ